MSSPSTSSPGVLATRSATKSPGDAKRNTNSPSSPPRCPICLSSQENPAKGDECSHKFCFPCLKEWSRVKAECPLCKKSMTRILYGENNSKEYLIPTSQPSASNDPYRATSEWWYHHSQAHLHNQRRLRESSLSAIRVSSNTAMVRRRRHYYWRGIKVSYVSTGNRVRDISPEFFRNNQVQTFRLIPWLKRELTVLFGSNNRQIIERVRDVIMSAIRWIEISSNEFYQELRPYFLQHTEHFIHEFLHFAQSPYDITEYDRQAVYTLNGLPLATLTRNGPPPNVPRPFGEQWNISPETRSSTISDSASSNLPSQQSLLLSQTTWDDDDLTTVDPRPLHDVPSSRTSSLFDEHLQLPRSNVYYMSMPPQPLVRAEPVSSFSYSFPRDTWAPLNNQSIDAVASTTRDRANEIRDKYERRRNRKRRHRQARSHAVRPADVIVISSSEEDQIPSSQANDQDVDNSNLHNDETPDLESESEIEFVKYIKPPHLRTPDAFIDLDSDSEKPGPSQPRTSVTPPRNSRGSSLSSIDSPMRCENINLKKCATIYLIDEPKNRTENQSKKMKIKPKKLSSFIRKADSVFENANAWRNDLAKLKTDADNRPKRPQSADLFEKSSHEVKKIRRLSSK